MRLLVVEDEAHLAEGLKRGLEAEGFAVDVAGNGTSDLPGVSPTTASGTGAPSVGKAHSCATLPCGTPSGRSSLSVSCRPCRSDPASSTGCCASVSTPT